MTMDPEWVPTHRHYKGGRYRVVGIARHSETEEELVVYETPDRRLWVRPRTMFEEEVTIDGVRQPRFARLDKE